MPSDDYLELESIFSKALERYETGEERYGRFCPEKDGRDFLAETEAEVLDGINYLGMFLMKLRRMREKLEQD